MRAVSSPPTSTGNGWSSCGEKTPGGCAHPHRPGRHGMKRATTATAAAVAGTGVAARTVDVWKVYGDSEATRIDALAGVTLDLQRGRFTAIMGPSGSGKS